MTTHDFQDGNGFGDGQSAKVEALSEDLSERFS